MYNLIVSGFRYILYANLEEHTVHGERKLKHNSRLYLVMPVVFLKLFLQRDRFLKFLYIYIKNAIIMSN